MKLWLGHLIQHLDGAVFIGQFVTYDRHALRDVKIRFHKFGEDSLLGCSRLYKTIQSIDPQLPVTGQWEPDNSDIFIEPKSESEFDGCSPLGSYRVSSDGRTLYGIALDGSVLLTYHRQ